MENDEREVMPRAEVMYWIDQFLNDPAYGWCSPDDVKEECGQLLARFLGFANKTRLKLTYSGLRKLTLSEQKKASKQLFLLFSGQYVLRKRTFEYTNRTKVWYEVVLCHDPKPIVVHRPVKAFVSVGRNGVKVRVQAAQVGPPAETMPSFGEVWKQLRKSS